MPSFISCSRKSAVRRGGSVPDEQIIAANMDTVFIINALNKDFNVRRIERYLIAVWESGAAPVVLLTKADLCESPEDYVAQVEAVAPGVPVHAVSSLMDQGKERQGSIWCKGKRSPLRVPPVPASRRLNWLSGQEMQRVQGIREEDARGRHTTTHRELFVFAGRRDYGGYAGHAGAAAVGFGRRVRGNLCGHCHARPAVPVP